MPSYYSVIRYVPSVIAGERINIGVIAFDDNSVQVKFLPDWDRVSCFAGGRDIAFLKEFKDEMEAAVSKGLLFPAEGSDRFQGMSRHERMLKLSQGWQNSIQFREPYGSTQDVDTLLADVAKEFFVEPG